VNRQFKRDMEKQRMGGEAPEQPVLPQRRKRDPRQFLREIRSELRKVAWPSRKELMSYTIVVLVSVSLITAYIFGLDQLFGQFVFWIFG
jgi:preprotein translocase subunit SecE